MKRETRCFTVIKEAILFWTTLRLFWPVIIGEAITFYCAIVLMYRAVYNETTHWAFGLFGIFIFSFQLHVHYYVERRLRSLSVPKAYK